MASQTLYTIQYTFAWIYKTSLKIFRSVPIHITPDMQKEQQQIH